LATVSPPNRGERSTRMVASLASAAFVAFWMETGLKALQWLSSVARQTLKPNLHLLRFVVDLLYCTTTSQVKSKVRLYYSALCS